MSWRPTASFETLRLRAQWLGQIRSFFRERSVLEVETPILSYASVPDPHIESMQARVNGQSRYLQTSPELYMKRLLAAGSGPIYQIARVFRNGEAGYLHNPEFTLVEWYRPGFDQYELMREVTDLFHMLMGSADWAVFHLRCEENRWSCPVIETDGWDAAMDWLLSIVIQPAMRGPIFVTDYPASQASLARLDPDNPAVSRRFELFVDGIEMANGFEELTDVVEQRQRFELENEIRKQKGLQPVPLDMLFLEALESGLPETAGVALGLDRLLMCKTGGNKVSDVMSFTL
jgi:lysyl-tRNA synthetase class 2